MHPVIMLAALAYSSFTDTPYQNDFPSNDAPQKLDVTEVWDCGLPGSIITFKSSAISPTPIIYPGNVSMSADMINIKDIPSENLYVRLRLNKLDPVKMVVPCFNNMGSCEYDVCNFVIPNNQGAFCAMGICQCPFKAGEYIGQNIPYQIPNMGGSIFAKILAGNYAGDMTFFNKATGEVFGCAGMRFAIRTAD